MDNDLMDSLRITEVFVSADAADPNGDGSVERPYAAIGAAQAAVRKMIRNGGLKNEVYIRFRAGTYYFSEPIVIGTEDCDEVYPVYYTNYGEEEVRIVGGVPVTGWSDPDGDGIYEADVSAFPSFHAMYADGVRLRNAREPNPETYIIRDPSHLQAVYGSETSWFGEVLKVTGTDGGQISTAYRKCAWSGDLQYLQGAREFISEPGEWAIEGNRVCRMPADPSTVDTEEIVAGLADDLFLLCGEAERPVKNIVIRGLTLEMNAFGENLIAHARANDVTGEYDCNLHGLVCLRNAVKIRVENCRMSNAGYMAVVLKGLAQDNIISGNDIQNTGYAGMFLIGENPGSLNFCSRRNTIIGNRIRHVGEFVGHGAGIYLMNSGENRIVHNDISHVPRYGISMKGIRYGVFPANGLADIPFEEHWKYNQTTGNYIGCNRIYNTGIRSGDGGGIEGWGIGRDNVIERNIIYNAYRGIAADGWRGHSIFLDDAAHYVRVTDNIIYDENAAAVNAGIFIKSIGNYVVNNVFDVGYAKNGAADIAPYICPAGGSVFERNIVYSGTGGTLNADGSLSEDGNGDRVMLYFTDGANSSGTSAYESLRRMNFNLYYNAVGKAQIRAEDELLSPEEWKSCERNIRRYDADSICEDPLFVDAANHDYRLREDSPAYRLGIRSIRTDDIGLPADFPFAEKAQ